MGSKRISFLWFRHHYPSVFSQRNNFAFETCMFTHLPFQAFSIYIQFHPTPSQLENSLTPRKSDPQLIFRTSCSSTSLQGHCILSYIPTHPQSHMAKITTFWFWLKSRATSTPQLYQVTLEQHSQTSASSSYLHKNLRTQQANSRNMLFSPGPTSRVGNVADGRGSLPMGQCPIETFCVNLL